MISRLDGEGESAGTSVRRRDPLSGQARLGAWVRSRAAKDRVAALEEALLGGAFWRLALRRLAVFGFARGWAIALHVMELTFLTEIFVARPFVASLALQNATLIAEAFWWGALEALRRRLRASGVSAAAQVLTTRYMTAAFVLGLVGCCIPLGRLGWRWRAGAAPTILDAYAFICLLRLAIDMVLRTFYSGVYAYGRVHRPAWSAPVGPTVLVGATVALWHWLAGWSFVVSLLASVIVSRALLWRFTLRAYRLSRVPLPAWRWRWRRRRRGADWHLLGESALAGTANLTTRLASVALLGAVLPSLMKRGDDEVQLLAYVLHLAAPLVLVTSQWAFIFYHDWKRLEADLAEVLARRLNLALLAVAAVIAAVAWGVTVVLALAFTGWRWAPLGHLLTALAPTYLGLSIWAALQMRGFSRGEFASQACSAVVALGAIALGGAATVDPSNPTLLYWTLAGCPWLAAATHAVLSRWMGRRRLEATATLDGWMALLRGRRGPLTVWRARMAGPRPAVVAEEVRRQLSAGDGVVAWKQWLFGFEAAPGAGRDVWLVRCAGLLAGLDVCHPPGGPEAAEELVRLGWLSPPGPAPNAGVLEREHARLFPTGFTLRVGRPPPAAFSVLPADVRQAIWREAIRRVTGKRRRGPSASASSSWQVTALAPEGRLTHVFVAPRRPDVGGAAESDPDHRAWAIVLQGAAWGVPPAATR